MESGEDEFERFVLYMSLPYDLTLDITMNHTNNIDKPMYDIYMDQFVSHNMIYNWTRRIVLLEPYYN